VQVEAFDVGMASSGTEWARYPGSQHVLNQLTAISLQIRVSKFATISTQVQVSSLQTRRIPAGHETRAGWSLRVGGCRGCMCSPACTWSPQAGVLINEVLSSNQASCRIAATTSACAPTPF